MFNVLQVPIAMYLPDERGNWREESSNLSHGTVPCKVYTSSHTSMKGIVQLKKRQEQKKEVKLLHVTIHFLSLQV